MKKENIVEDVVDKLEIQEENRNIEMTEEEDKEENTETTEGEDKEENTETTEGEDKEENTETTEGEGKEENTEMTEGEGKEENTETKEGEDKEENIELIEETEKNNKKKNKENRWNKKITGTKKIIIIICLALIIIGVIIGVLLTIKDSKVEGFIVNKKDITTQTSKPIVTYEEYIKNSKEYFYERLVVNIGKDYIGQITLGEEIIFVKDKTNQKAVIHMKENDVSKKDAIKSLGKYIKKLNKNAEYVKKIELNKNEFHIYLGKEKDGKKTKYAVGASDDTKIILTYTYNKDGEDEDIEYILKSMRF